MGGSGDDGREPGATACSTRRRPERNNGRSLGGHIARNRQVPWLHAARLATPEGVVPSGLWLAPGSEGRFGIITSAGLHIRALPSKTEYRRYLFSDFAGGLTAFREAQRQGLAQSKAYLWDSSETLFHQQMNSMSRSRTVSDWAGDIHRRLRQFDSHAAALTIGFSGSKFEAHSLRKRFDALARRLGALALGLCTPDEPDYRDILMDRGLATDPIETTRELGKAAPRLRGDAREPRPGHARRHAAQRRPWRGAGQGQRRLP